jgi:membrane fusion protein (multidrug efflux system)
MITEEKNAPKPPETWADDPDRIEDAELDAELARLSSRRSGKSAPANGKYAPAKSEDQPDKSKDTPDTEKPAADKPRPNPRRQLILALVASVVLVLAVLWGVRYYHYAQTHVSTDDAYVSGNLVNVSPIISGTLNHLAVQEGDRVRAGQLIARLEDSGAQASVRQAQASYDAARTQIPQARISLAYQQQATDAAIRSAQAEIGAQSAKTSGAQQQVTLTAATMADQVRQAQRQAVQTAQRAADTDAAKIASAEADQLKAVRDEARYATLVKQQAVTQQKYDQVQATTISAQSDLQSAREQAAESRSRVLGAQADVEQALAQLKAAQHSADAAQKDIDVYRAGLTLAQSNLKQVGIKQADVANNLQQGGQAQASLATALAGRRQIALKERQIETYQAQAAESKAALANAQVTERDTFIYAPTDGQVVRKAVSVGAALSPGQTIVTLTAGSEVWVTANFKETQLTHVRRGQSAEVEVDTFPGKVFRGRVQAIEEATGSSTALLPPDNATGNFTKVVQRVPVRISLIAAGDGDDKKYARAADIAGLRQGLSVTATVDTSSDTH